MDKPFNPFEFLTTPWGALPMGAAMPGANAFNMTDLREIDKRIAELKAVEQWLNLNLNLLRTTIQGLEVQRGTLAAIQSFSESMAKASGTGQQEGGASQASSANPFAGAAMAGSEQAAAWWDSMQRQFTQMMQAAQASAQSMVSSASGQSDSGNTPSGGGSAAQGNSINNPAA